jgi:hypothetical protein
LTKHHRLGFFFSPNLSKNKHFRQENVKAALSLAVHSPVVDPKSFPERAMSSLSADAIAMANLLAVLTQPDTEAIRQAEMALKPILKDPRCVPALVEILKARDTQVSGG